MAFYATFLPSRETSRALGQTNATADLTYSGVAGVQPPQTLSFTVASRSTAQPSPETLALPAPAVQGESAGLLAPDDPDLRVAASGTNAAGGGATGLGSTAFPACDTSQSPLYCVYTVEKGDTLGAIAVKFGLKSTGEIAAYDLLVQSNKPDIASGDDFIQPEQKLRIPTQNGLVHTVRSNDTLIDIASTYDVTPASIVAVLGNGITNLDSLKVGQEVLVPNPQRLAKPVPAPAPSSAGSSSASSPQIIRGSQVSKSGFIWPVTGPISSYFGPSHPLGIDIDLYASPNAPIASVASGTVTFAGGNTCCSYGLYVIVSHGNGFETLYAHLSKISVTTGQKVQQGQVLGNGGRTGYATGNHLHFEVHLSNGAIVNPLSYLP